MSEQRDMQCINCKGTMKAEWDKELRKAPKYLERVDSYIFDEKQLTLGNCYRITIGEEISFGILSEIQRSEIAFTVYEKSAGACVSHTLRSVDVLKGIVKLEGLI